MSLVLGVLVLSLMAEKLGKKGKVLKLYGWAER
jgi:hypothetical protein